MKHPYRPLRPASVERPETRVTNTCMSRSTLSIRGAVDPYTAGGVRGSRRCSGGWRRAGDSAVFLLEWLILQALAAWCCWCSFCSQVACFHSCELQQMTAASVCRCSNSRQLPHGQDQHDAADGGGLARSCGRGSLLR
ncbi:hypothetical protein PVAP13_8NG252401 [Panicum virgatum]|uniref:Uncharacterized protein n=1 Tax=Panicum virgatum TaxID=38727 RepID=A0A8T0P7J8_PANVG|nr:hypothetical protein PVAP13_8NG252401 [Panicum virgatum]